MPEISQARRKFSVTMILLSLICASSAGVLLSSVGRSLRPNQRQVAQLREELQAKNRELASLQGFDERIRTAKEEGDRFYRDRLPANYASLSYTLGKVATQSGVQFRAGQYTAEPAELSGLKRITVDADISGDYLQIVKFIHAMERETMFFLVKSIAVAPQQNGAIQLQIQVETYLKGA